MLIDSSNILSSGVVMDTAAAKAVLSVDLYDSKITFLGGTKGLKTKGEMGGRGWDD